MNDADPEILKMLEMSKGQISFLFVPRKSKLKTTGPWLLVESDMKLADVAIQTDPGDTVAFCVAVWAVSVKGDVYCRDGVHADNPTVV